MPSLDAQLFPNQQGPSLVADMRRRVALLFRRNKMVDRLLIVEAVLDREGVFHYRDEDYVLFTLPFGRTSYDCSIREFMGDLILRADWTGAIDSNEIDRAEAVLLRLIEAVLGGSGKTYLKRRSGRVCYVTSVDVSLVELTVERMASMLEAMLDPFNVMLLAMDNVLQGAMTEDAAVDAYAAWDRKRIAALLNPAGAERGPDPSLN